MATLAERSIGPAWVPVTAKGGDEAVAGAGLSEGAEVEDFADRKTYENDDRY